MLRLSKHIPAAIWLRSYDRQVLVSDLLAALIVTVMLIPQSLAYAMLAGLPPEIGLYASMFPLVAYAIFGTSRTLAVGPVAVVSLMTASAIGQVAAKGTAGYLEAAVALALLSGCILLAMGVCRLGFLANLLSHPVISGFITSAAILIAAGQLRHIVGVAGHGDTLPDIFISLAKQVGSFNVWTLAIGAAVLLFLVFTRQRLKPLLTSAGLPARVADLMTRSAPIAAVGGAIVLTETFDLRTHGVILVGKIPQGLPAFGVPALSLDLLANLLVPALLISIVGFVESVSVAQTLAARRRQRIDPNRELVGLGVANLAAGLSSAYPVTGGFARSVVNFDAGAQTPMASIFTAGGISLAALYLTPLLSSLPQATLAATIIIAVLSLIDLQSIRRVFAYSRSDFFAMTATIVVTLGWGVELGIVAGILSSLLLHLYRTSKPHIAVVGQVPNTEHYRNVERHPVLMVPAVLSLRIDESLYFANSRYLEERITSLVAERPELKHVLLMCSAVNFIDSSALDVLQEVNERLGQAGIGFHLSEVKGPVMDRLRSTQFLECLNGRVFLSQHEAMQALAQVGAA